jgi:heavy metal translocating P-type ATPase
MKKIKFIKFDKFLLVVIAIILVGHYAKIIPLKVDEFFLTFFASIATLPVLLSAYRSLRQKKVTVDLLASVALVVSILNKEWASAVFINLMLTSARIFSDYTENKSRSAIKSLLKLRPEKVKVKKRNHIVETAISKIKKGDLIVIELGDRIPVDGEVTSGDAQIDQSSLTGESAPVHKKKGDSVLSSTLNVSGSLIIRAEKVGKDTTFEKIVKLVERSQQDKSSINTLAEKFASRYVILSIVGSAILYAYSHNMSLVLSVLLVTCADDIAVAIPMAFSAAVGRAAKRGIIIKGGNFLEGLTKVKTLVFDKTGTITKGSLKVEKIIPFDQYKKNDVLKLAAMSECFSEHPVAKAVIKCAQENSLAFKEPEKFQEYSGKGSTAMFKNKRIACGKEPFLKELNITISAKDEKVLDGIKKEGSSSILLVSYTGDLAGIITLTDEIRSETKKTISELKKLGVEKIVMLTGDNESVAKTVAKKTGIDVFHANLLPEDKLRYIRKYLNKKSKVAMVGDGVNDAAALTLADIGIAMGAIGSDTAIEAADIALMQDDLSKIPEAFELGNTVTKISRQDFWIWGIVNAIGLSLVFGGIIGPEGAAAFNFITDFFPILNSLRLFGYKFKDVQI